MNEYRDYEEYEEEEDDIFLEALCDLIGLCDGKACPYYRNCKEQEKG